MARLIHASRHQPCPICGKLDACRRTEDTNPLYFCLRVHSSLQTPSGWHYLGDDKNGVFGLFKPDNKKEYRPWQVKNVLPPNQPNPDAPTIADKLITNRASGYEGLLSQLSIDPLHSYWVKKKGLPDAAIQHFNLKSYTMATRLDGMASELPGISPGEPEKMIGKGGLLLPVRNFKQQLLGFQVVPSGRIAQESHGRPWNKSKYIWLSSKAKGGQGPSLPEPYNALPLGYFQPDTLNDPKTLYLSEGILKSMIICYRMGWHILGTASAGRFCPKQLEETIQSGEFSRVVLIPDAGMLDNANIARAYASTAKAVQQIGRQLECLWWEQTTKATADFDELITDGKTDSYRVLSFDEYFLKQSIETQEQADRLKFLKKLFWLPREVPVHPKPTPNTANIREEMAKAFENILLQGRSGKGLLHLFQDPAGTGKTTTLARTVKQLHDAGRLKDRVLFLVRTKERITDLEQILGDAAFYAYGRTESPESNFYCQKLEEYARIANARFNPGQFCLNCHDELEYLRKTCPYKEQQKAANHARIVVATNHSYMGESSRIEKFATIIIDEDLTSSGITEQVSINPGRDFEKIRNIIQSKPDLQQQFPPMHPLWPLLDQLESLAMAGTDSPEEQLQSIWERLEASSVFTLIGQFMANWPINNPEEAFPFENRALLSEGGPRRLMFDLIRALTDGKERLITSNGRIIFERPCASLSVLRNKKVISLDATPLVSLLENIWSPEKICRYGDLNYAPNVEVTQVIGRVFSPGKLSTTDTQKLQTVVKSFIQNYSKPLIIMPKSLAPKLTEEDTSTMLHIDHENLQVGWWGNQTRGSNDYLDCDIAVLVGNYQINPEAMRLRVNALRQTSAIQGKMREILQPMTLAGHGWLIPYRFQSCEPDPLVQLTMQEAQAAEYAQAIGRLRAINRDKPVQVVILNGYVLKGLRVDSVLEWQSLMHSNPEQRKRPNIEQLNHEKSEQALQTLASFLAKSPKDISKAQVARETGLSRNTIAKYWKQAQAIS